MGLDFMQVCTRLNSKKIIEVYPKFIIGRSNDLMTRGGDVYAVWDEGNKKWLTREQDIVLLIDNEIRKELELVTEEEPKAIPLYLRDTDTKMIDKWHKFVQKDLREQYIPLDRKFVFDNEEPKRDNYSTICLPYHLEDKETPAYDHLTSVLYSPTELHKIEWCIGAILSGDSKDIQKFLVITGDAGAGKSTMLNIMEQLFQGYYISFDSKQLVNGGQFSFEQFKTNPLVAIEHDGNLAHIADNSRLNSLISHEKVAMRELYRASYTMKFDTFLIMASNLPVEITDAKSGLTRRIIDAEPSGNRLDFDDYISTVEQIKFELGGIAKHCLDVYNKNKHFYDKYRPEKQISKTYRFYDYIDYMEREFTKEDATTLDYAWGKYRKYVELSGERYPFDRLRFKNELMEFFKEFYPRRRVAGKDYRNMYMGFISDRLASHNVIEETDNLPVWLKMEMYEKSAFDEMGELYPAQLTKEDGTPAYKWENVKTCLKDINTKELHYVKVPLNHIVIDFDIPDENGEKSLEKNLEAASKWPKTYAELSKSGKGIHLHYIYDGDPEKLSAIYEPNIEIKVFKGNSSLRRKLTLCNNNIISHISSGLPLKEETKKMLNKETIKSEVGLRKLILRNLNKEIHDNTSQSVNFIHSILQEAYESGMHYDVSDMFPAISAFASQSKHQSERCQKLVLDMKFKSDEPSEGEEWPDEEQAPILYFDVEVFPNLFVICHKLQGVGKPVQMINPSKEEVMKLFDYRLVGFNNRRYDNHILYAAGVGGYNNEQLFKLSQRIVSGSNNAFFGEAYGLSYADVYEYSSKKQSLKKWEIDLGIFHLENSYPWDQPVAEEHWQEIADYCSNDVIATEKTAEACHQDFVAREILSKLSGLPVGYTTRQHTTKIIFEGNRNPELVYTDLSEDFPGYTFDNGKSMYRGEETGEGGYVYAEPGIYENVALLDIASMHPHSILALNLFGEYTERFADILNARIAIKHHDYEKAKTMLDGALAEFLSTDEDADALAGALKIVINSVYGYTTATFDNPFKDPRNVDNIVAKRGALFMVNLKHEVQERGFTVAHIKTDSIKIPNATPEIISFVTEYGKKYGYNFEHEATYEKMCLVNDAVYIAKYADGKHAGEWTATGTQFQVPYVFKNLFSKEPIIFDDMCETKSVTSSLYLDFNENLPDISEYEEVLRLRHSPAELEEIMYTNNKKAKLLDAYRDYSDEQLLDKIKEGHDYRFIGRIGKFTPVKPGCGGALLLREKDGKYNAATGTKGYRWMESEMVRDHQDIIDISYYRKLVDEARAAIEQYGDVNNFIK